MISRAMALILCILVSLLLQVSALAHSSVDAVTDSEAAVTDSSASCDEGQCCSRRVLTWPHHREFPKTDGQTIS